MARFSQSSSSTVGKSRNASRSAASRALIGLGMTTGSFHLPRPAALSQHDVKIVESRRQASLSLPCDLTDFRRRLLQPVQLRFTNPGWMSIGPGALDQHVANTAIARLRDAATLIVSQATYFNWKKKYDGLLPTEMRRLKQLEDENAKLRKVVADLSLDKEMLQDAIRSLSRSASWLTRCGVSGVYRSGGAAGCSKSTPPSITTSPVAPDRPPSKVTSGRFARRGFAMAIAVSTSCFDAKAGTGDPKFGLRAAKPTLSHRLVQKSPVR